LVSGADIRMPSIFVVDASVLSQKIRSTVH
jgi:hypothetical protein